MKALNRVLFLFLAILVSGIAVSEAVFRGAWLWMQVAGGNIMDQPLPVALAAGSLLTPFVAVPGLWISIRRGAVRATWAFFALLLVFPILGAAFGG